MKIKKIKIAKKLRKNVSWPRKTDLTATRHGQRVIFWSFFCHRLSDLNSGGDLNKNSRGMDSVTK